MARTWLGLRSGSAGVGVAVVVGVGVGFGFGVLVRPAVEVRP